MIVQSRTQDESRRGTGCECWLLHGNVGRASDWRNFAGDLGSRGIATRAVDLWRFLCCEPLSLEQTASALNAEAADSGPLPKILIGYSLGGRIALHALLSQPGPWAAAVIISAHPGLENETERIERRATDAAWAAMAFSGTWQSFIDAWNAQSILSGALPRPDADQRRLLARRSEIARGFVAWSLGQQAPLWQMLPHLQVPVLWVAGENDPKYAALAARAANSRSTSRLACLAQAGHRVPWDVPGALLQEVLSFLDEPGTLRPHDGKVAGGETGPRPE